MKLLPIIVLAVVAGSAVMAFPAFFTGAANQPTTLLNQMSGERVSFGPTYFTVDNASVKADEDTLAMSQAPVTGAGPQVLGVTVGPPVILAIGIAAAASVYLVMKKSLLGHMPS